MAIADGRLVTWYYPSAISIDRDLLTLASTSRDAAEFGKVFSPPESVTYLVAILTARINKKKGDAWTQNVNVCKHASTKIV